MAGEKPDSRPEAVLYALLSCPHCRRAKDHLQRHGIPFVVHYVDLLTGEERSNALAALRRWNPSCTFPTLVLDNEVVVGFQPDEIDRVLRNMNRL